jgi:chemotaxis protein MotA
MADKNTPGQGGAGGKKGHGVRPDFATIGGLAVAALGLIGGLLLEGGSMKDITQPTAFLIVLGGTMGAVMVNFPMKTLIGGVGRLKHVFFEQSESATAMIEELVTYATKARKQGIVSLERDAEALDDPFLKKALSLAVDGTDLQELRRMLELEIEQFEHHAGEEAKVWEAAGGYSPTVGIIGAVMGLIQVMKNLADIDAVGHGIATAFVATVYGVAFANIVFLPAGAKIKVRALRDVQMMELVVEGISGIVEGLNPKLIRSKLEAYAHVEEGKKSKKKGVKAPAGESPENAPAT